MELNAALAFAATRRNAILTTLRADGRPQQSMVFYLCDGDRFIMSITQTRAKARNLRRDPRAALFIPSDDVFAWVSFDGTAELTDPALTPDDAVADQLVDYYRRSNGEHGDWAEYRRAMVDDQRLIATFTATSATGILPT